MKLVELEPRWFAADGRQGMGIGFNCPHCVLTAAALGTPIERIQIPFSNPIDGGLDFPRLAGYLARWDRQGATFETLTISPSINMTGHWHGYITGGEVRPA